MNNNPFPAYSFDADKYADIVRTARKTMNRTMKHSMALSEFLNEDTYNFITLDSVPEELR